MRYSRPRPPSGRAWPAPSRAATPGRPGGSANAPSATGSARPGRAPVRARARPGPPRAHSPSSRPHYEQGQQPQERDHQVREVGVGRARLQCADPNAPSSHPGDERRVQVALEPRDDLAAVLDGLHEVPRFRVKVDREVLGGPVQLGEHAAQRLGKRDAKSRTTSHAAPVIRIRPRATSVGDIRANPLGIDRETPEPNPGTGTGRRAEPASAAASAGMTTTAANPKTAQATARIPMPTRIDTGASCAHSAAGERGIARNVIPKALTNPAAASPAVSASTLTASVMSGATIGARLSMPGSSDWKRSHSLTKPFSGGSPAMARAPTRKKAAVQGRPRMRP